MLERDQIEAIVELANSPKYGYDAAVEAERIGVTVGSLRVHVYKVRAGEMPPSWRRILGETE